MDASYLLRLAGLCFASFFLVNAFCGLIALACIPLAIRTAERMEPRAAGRLLLAVRLGPALFGLFVVFALCIPSYLWFEPQATHEDMGLLCAGAGLLGLLAWVLSFTRVVRAVAGSSRYAGRCRCVGRATTIGGTGARMPALAIEHPSALLALCGVFRPTLLVSRAVLETLSPDQMDAALCHERAHWAAHDNLARLLLLLAPDVLFLRGPFRALEGRWARFAEWAADDEAAAGDPFRALALASALVCVAKVGRPPVLALTSSFTSGGLDLEARVERLLRVEQRGPAAHPADSGPRFRVFAGVAALSCAVLVFSASLLPSVMPSIYRLLEDLVR